MPATQWRNRSDIETTELMTDKFQDQALSYFKKRQNETTLKKYLLHQKYKDATVRQPTRSKI